MLYYSLYRASAEVYLWTGAIASLILCILGWLLLSQAAGKRLHSFVHWFLPSMIASSLLAAGFLLTAFLSFTHSRDYTLGIFIYLFSFAGVAVHAVSFARLWKTVTALPPNTGEQPQWNNAEQDAGVWPPPPQR